MLRPHKVIAPARVSGELDGWAAKVALEHEKMIPRLEERKK